MTSPYLVLGVSEEANDEAIKQAYLQKVKENPPDRDQAEFQRVQQAYQAVKDRHSRLHHALFELPSMEFGSLLDRGFQQTTELTPISADLFLNLLNATAATAHSKANASLSKTSR